MLQDGIPEFPIKYIAIVPDWKTHTTGMYKQVWCYTDNTKY